MGEAAALPAAGSSDVVVKIGFGAGLIGLLALIGIAIAAPVEPVASSRIAQLLSTDALLRSFGLALMIALGGSMFTAVRRDSARLANGQAGEGSESRVVPARAEATSANADALVEAAVARARAEAEAERELLRTRIGDLESRVEELASVNRDLESRNVELDGFCHAVSHDLRSPLRAIDGFSEMLADDYGAALDEQGRHCLSRLRAASARMGATIEAFLMLGRVDEVEVEPQPVDLGFLARDVVQELCESDPHRSVAFNFATDLSAIGDPKLTRVLLANLLGNAWKFTSKREGARIELSVARRVGADAVYFVRDNGVGFDPEQRSRMFEPFERLHDSREFEGNGVGLATVARIVARHGGRVWSEGMPNKGATIYFTLPPSAAKHQRAAASCAEDARQSAEAAAAKAAQLPPQSSSFAEGSASAAA